MRPVPGSLLLLFSASLALAGAWRFEVQTPREQFYVGEPVPLSVVFIRSNQEENVKGEALPPQNPDGNATLFHLHEEPGETEHRLRYLFSFIPATPGPLVLPLYGKVFTYTNEDLSAASSFKDSAWTISGHTEEKKAGEVRLRVLPVPEPGLPVGSFTLDATLDETTVLPGEPAHLEVVLKGTGSIIGLIPPVPEISGASLFPGEPERQVDGNESGFTGTLRQEFSLVGQEDFTVESILFRFLDPSTGEVKTLTTPRFRVDVEKELEPTRGLVNLPDKEEEKGEAGVLFSLAAGLLLFAAGFVTGKLVRLPRFRRKVPTEADRVKKVRDAKTLFRFLAPHAHDPRFRELARRLEEEPETWKTVREEAVRLFRSGKGAPR